jgi:hypothetical protein
MEIKLIHRDSLSCEPAIRRAPNGDLLIVSMCEGLKEPLTDNKAFLFRSVDNGKTFANLGNMLPNDPRGVTTPELCVIEDKIFLFLGMHTGKQTDFENRLFVSEDNGYNFEDRGCFEPLPYFASIREMIRKKNGDLLFAYQYFPITKEENERLNKNDSYIFEADIDYIESGVLLSKDNGTTFEKYVANKQYIDKSIPKHKYLRWNWPEPSIIELEDNHIVMLMRRNNTGYLYRCDSFDGGKTFGEAFKTDIPNPGNKFQLIKLSDGRIALLNTPNNIYSYETRNPLEIWISDDQMNSWYIKDRVSDFPGLYAYPSGFEDQENKELIFTFEFNRHDIYLVKYKL